ncbi:MAG: translation initiation factor IF-3 [Hyphomicrobiaceae bacterium]|nr:translation initiation factor IF-3 [Hyphomicrobiaceae bacterium]
MKAAAPEREREGPRVNDTIRVREVQLIDAEGNNRGVVGRVEALELARESGLDLVEVAPNAQPPVCKILDYGKFKYQEQKKAAEARKNQKIVEIKEIKLRPNIDSHDYDVKMRSMLRFFEEGDKVKVTLRFRGREMAHQELGYQLLQKVKADVDTIAKVESEPRLEGRQMVMILSPR